MKYIFFPLLLLSISFLSCDHALEPLEISQKIFSKDTGFDSKIYIEDRLQSNLSKEKLQKYSFGQFFLIQQTDKDAVVSMVLIDSTGFKTNTYVYFKKETNWKIKSVSEFTLLYVTAWARQMQQTTAAQIDSIAEASNEPNAKETFQKRIEAIRFACETDSTFVDYFLKHKSKLEKIKNAIMPKLDKEDRNSDVVFSDSFQTEMTELGLEDINYEGDDDFPHCLNFRIIMGGSSAGYIYVPKEEDIPNKFSPDGLMMVRKIEDNWYLYRIK